MMSLRIGLTGGIASGKSTVSNWLKEWNYPVIDADEIAKQVMKKDGQAYQKVVAAFSTDILLENKEIDRVKLGEMIFTNEQLRTQLNAIVHPIVQAEMERLYRRYHEKGEPLVVFDVPLLLEGKMELKVDMVLVVAVDEATQLDRLMKRNHLSREEALSRIRAQMPAEVRLSHADFVIDNGGTLMHTQSQLKKIIEIIQKTSIKQ